MTIFRKKKEVFDRDSQTECFLFTYKKKKKDNPNKKFLLIFLDLKLVRGCFEGKPPTFIAGDIFRGTLKLKITQHFQRPLKQLRFILGIMKKKGIKNGKSKKTFKRFI